MKTKIAAGLGLAVFCAGVAMANGHAGKMHGGKMHHGMMADGVTTRAEVEAKVKEHFASMDANKDGSVTTEERSAARQVRMAEMKDAHFKAMDTNSDGSISRAEFDAGHSERAGDTAGNRRGMRHRGGDHEGGRRGTHRDTDGNGKLTLAEALAGPLARFDRIDADKNGTISDAERAAHRDLRKERRHDRRMKWRERRG